MMIDVKTNFKGLYQDNLKCELQYQNIFCYKEQLQSHIMDCEAIRNVQPRPPPLWIIGLISAAKYLQKVYFQGYKSVLSQTFINKCTVPSSSTTQNVMTNFWYYFPFSNFMVLHAVTCVTISEISRSVTVFEYSDICTQTSLLAENTLSQNTPNFTQCVIILQIVYGTSFISEQYINRNIL